MTATKGATMYDETNDDDTVAIVKDPSGDGWSFETPDGDGYGGHSLEEAIDTARRLGYDYEVER